MRKPFQNTMFVLPNVKGGGAGSSTYSLSSCPCRGFSCTLSLAFGYLDAFLMRLRKGSESEKSGCSRVRVKWSWKATEVITNLLSVLDFMFCKICSALQFH